MPNQRASGQICIAFTLDGGLLAAMDKARVERFARLPSRSEFIRIAVVAYLEDEMGLTFERDLVSSPNRAGKPRSSMPLDRFNYGVAPAGGEVLNDAGNSQAVQIARRVVADMKAGKGKAKR